MSSVDQTLKELIEIAKKICKYFNLAAKIVIETLIGADNKRAKIVTKKFVEYHLNKIFVEEIETIKKIHPSNIVDMKITSFICSYIKTIEKAGIRNTDDKITQDSINESIQRSLNKMYHIFVVNNVKLPQLWVICKKQDELATYLDHSYFHCQEYVNYLAKLLNKTNEELMKMVKINVTYTKFKTEIESKTEIIKYIIKDGIESNEKIVSDKEEVKDVSDKIMNIFSKNMTKGGVVSDNDLNPMQIAMKPNTQEAIKNAKVDIENYVKSENVKRSHLTDITSSAIKIYKDSPEVKHDKNFAIAMNTFVTQLDRRTQGAKLDRESRRLVREIKESFYNPDLPVDPKITALLNEHDRKQKILMRLAKKKKKLEEQKKQTNHVKDSSKTP